MDRALATAISKYPDLAAFVEIAGERLDALELEQLLIYLTEIVDAGALPVLAAQFDVEGYKGMSLAETDAERREIIRNAIEMHRKKGTPFAVIEAVKSAGYAGAQILPHIGQYHDGSAFYAGRIRHAGIEQNWACFNLIIDTRGVPLDETKIRKYVDEYKPVRSFLVNIGTAPPAPVTDIHITYQWDGWVELAGTPGEAENIVGYNAYYDYGFGLRKANEELLSAGDLAGYMMSGLPTGHDYAFWFTAVDEAGVESEPSVKALTSVVSAAPVNVKAAFIGDEYMHITADPGPEEETAGYNAWKDDGSGPVKDNAELLSDAEIADYFFEGLTNDVTYKFWFTAVSVDGKESGPSEIIEATPAFAAPSPVELIEAWDTVVFVSAGPGREDEVISYNAYYDAGAGPVKHNTAPFPVGELADYAFDGLANGTEYEFWFTGVDTNGRETNPSDTVTATPIAAAPVGTELLDAGDRYARAGAGPGANPNIIGYDAYYDSGAGPVRHNTALLDAAAIADYLFDGLENGETYDLWFTAVSAAGNTKAGAKVQAAPLLTAPAGLALTAQPTYIDAQVDEHPAAVTYNWYLDGVLAGSTGPGNVYFRFADLEPGTAYTVTVTVTNDADEESAPASESITTPVVCDLTIDSVAPVYNKTPGTGHIDVIENNISAIPAQGWIDVIENNLIGEPVPAQGWIDVIANNIDEGDTETHAITVGANSIPGVVVDGGGPPQFDTSFDVSGQFDNPVNLTFSPDGTRMFIAGYAYLLSTPWDISTAVFTGDFIDFSPAPSQIYYGSTISPDGLRFYAVGSLDDTVHSYALTTAWDVTTATYTGGYGVGPRSAVPNGITFRPDGLRMFITNSNPGVVYSYALTTAWDVTTATYTGESFNLSVPFTNPRDMAFSPDGAQMFVVGGGDNVAAFDLATPWDLTTVTYIQNFKTTAQETFIHGIAFSSDGMNMFISGSINDAVYAYSLSAPWEIGVAISTQAAAGAYAAAINNDATVSQDWTASTADQGGGVWRCLITAREPGPAWNGETIAVSGNTDVSLATQNTAGGAGASETHTVTVGEHQTEAVITGGGGAPEQGAAVAYADAINAAPAIAADWEATVTDNAGIPRCLITAREAGPDWNGATVAVTGAVEVTVQTQDAEGGAQGEETHAITIGADTIEGIKVGPGGAPELEHNIELISSASAYGLAFSADGVRMYVNSGAAIGGGLPAACYAYALSEPWDISTAVYTGDSFSFSAEEQQSRGIAFSPDGAKMYMGGTREQTIYTYALSTPWDITTATVLTSETLDISDILSNATAFGIVFSPDGTRFFFMEGREDTVHAYDLTEPWDLSTATYRNESFFVGDQASLPFGLAFNSEGTRLYVPDNSTKTVYVYDLSDPWDLTTASYSGVSFSPEPIGTPWNPFFQADGKRIFIPIGDEICSFILPAPYEIGTLTPEQAVAATYAWAVNSDPVVSENWQAETADDGDGSWRCVITSNWPGPEWNGIPVSVAGNVEVTVSTAATSGGTYIIDIIVAATSSHPPIEYSLWLDEALYREWQASGEFSGVDTGEYTARVRDAGECVAEREITVI